MGPAGGDAAASSTGKWACRWQGGWAAGRVGGDVLQFEPRLLARLHLFLELSLMSLPSAELLREMHAFPCAFTFKVIGKTNDGFVARVIAAVRERLALEIDPPYQLKHTAGGRHVSITMEPWVTTAEEVLTVYQALQPITGVVCIF